MDDKKTVVKSLLAKVKLVDAGVTYEPYKPGPEIKGPRKDYPAIYLSVKQAPMLSGKEVGDEIDMVVKGKIISHSMNNNLDRKNEEYRVEIRKIGVAGK